MSTQTNSSLNLINLFCSLNLVDATASENYKLNNGKGQRRRLKKNSQVVESDDASSHKSEDEDGYLLSVFKSKRTEKTTSAGTEANNINQNILTVNGKDQKHSLDLWVSSIATLCVCIYVYMYTPSILVNYFYMPLSWHQIISGVFSVKPKRKRKERSKQDKRNEVEASKNL